MFGEALSNDEGDGSVFGDLEELVIEAWRFGDSWTVKLGKRNEGIGAGRRMARLSNDRELIATFMAYYRYQYYYHAGTVP